jgi:hypothetical protein
MLKSTQREIIIDQLNGLLRELSAEAEKVWME